MAFGPIDHWGTWISRRADFVGFKRQQDLAVAIGCSRTQLDKWFKLESPPSKMRKGFDRSLASALIVTREILFSEWSGIAPENAKVYSEKTISVAVEELYPQDAAKRQTCTLILKFLYGPELEEASQFLEIIFIRASKRFSENKKVPYCSF